jgi:hypothetical protein
MRNTSPGPPDVKVPNALIGELYNPSPESFWRVLQHRSYLVALGLLGLVDPNEPGKEVTTKATKIIEIIEDARNIEHRYLDEWHRVDGAQVKKGRATKVFRPKLYGEVGAALVRLFTTAFQINTVRCERLTRGKESSISRRKSQTFVHFLDSFRFIYVDHGEELDLDLVSPGELENISPVEDRPVYKLRGGQRPSFISFRLNTELADELAGKGRRYTTFLGAIFGVLKKLANDPAAARTALWVISQRKKEITRSRAWVLTRLIAGAKNRTAQEGQRRLEEVLKKLKGLEVVVNVMEKPYAVKSRGKGTYIVITKAEHWHLARAKEQAQ